MAKATQAARGEIVNTVQALGANTLCLPDLTPAPCSSASTLSVIPPPPAPGEPSRPDSSDSLAATGQSTQTYAIPAAVLVVAGTVAMVARLKEFSGSS